jgi:dTDP-4-amino-4,6-dideoxygalactose transaminase
MSLVALGVGPGDEVLVSDFTFPATANVVLQQGARPVLVDVQRGTFTLDPGSLERLVTHRTRAVIPVHAFGLSADMDVVTRVARNHRLAVIEDAACALGAQHRGAMCGTLGDVGCFSFHPRKSVTTGEGGAVVTNRADVAQRLMTLRNHGGVRRGFYYEFEEAGFNYRMSDLQAAVGVAQMRRLDSLITRKRALASQLSQLLRDVEGVVPPVEPAGCFHTYQSYVVTLDEAVDRDRVIAAMRRRHIETTLGTYALHAQPYFRQLGYSPGDLPGSYDSFRHSLTLPLYAQMAPRDLERVVENLVESLREVA